MGIELKLLKERTFNSRNKGINQQHTEINWMQIRNLIVPIKQGHVCLACLLINLGTVSIREKYEPICKYKTVLHLSKIIL